MLKVAEVINNLSSKDFDNLVDILIQYDGFHQDDERIPMEELDDFFPRTSDFARTVSSDFNYFDNYFYYDGNGIVHSTYDRDYCDVVDGEEIAEELDGIKDDIREDIEYTIHSDELLEALYGDENE